MRRIVLPLIAAAAALAGCMEQLSAPPSAAPPATLPTAVIELATAAPPATLTTAAPLPQAAPPPADGVPWLTPIDCANPQTDVEAAACVASGGQ